MEKIKKIVPDITEEQFAAISELFASEYERGKNDAEAGFNKSRKEEQIDEKIKAAGAKNVKAVKALLDLESAQNDEKSLQQQLDALKKECPYLFEDGEKKPQFTSGKAKNGSLDKKAFENMSYRKRLKLFSDNPELYKQLAN